MRRSRSLLWLALTASASIGCATIPDDQSYRVLTPSEASTVSAITGPLFDDYSLIASPTYIDAVALSHDGSLAAAKHDAMTLWDVEDGSVVAEWSGFDRRGRRNWLGFHPSRARFAVVTRGGLELHDTERQLLLTTWELPAGDWDEVHGCMNGDQLTLALRRDFTTAEITSDDPIAGGLTLWQPRRGASWTVPVGIGDIHFAQGCSALLTVGHAGGLFYDLSTATPTQHSWRNRHEDASSSFAAVLSPSGRRIVSHSWGRVDVIDSFADRLLDSWQHEGGSTWEVWNPLAMDPTGRWLAHSDAHFGGFNASPSDLVLIDMRSRKRCAALSGHRDSIVSVAFSGDGRRIATGSRDQSLRIWQLPASCKRPGR